MKRATEVAVTVLVATEAILITVVVAIPAISVAPGITFGVISAFEGFTEIAAIELAAPVSLSFYRSGLTGRITIKRDLAGLVCALAHIGVKTPESKVNFTSVFCVLD